MHVSVKTCADIFSTHLVIAPHHCIVTLSQPPTCSSFKISLLIALFDIHHVVFGVEFLVHFI